MSKLTVNPAEALSSSTIIAGGSFTATKDSAELDTLGFDWLELMHDVNVGSNFTSITYELRETAVSGTAFTSMDAIAGGTFTVGATTVAMRKALVDLHARKRYVMVRVTLTGTNWVGSVHANLLGVPHSEHVSNTYQFSV